ncbi:MAG: chorismate-binding protein [Tannerellaceae bacterium]|jgi:isochorismate synthase|nr:chorismate-binding protein [Tannerellaceae bacterium]
MKDLLTGRLRDILLSGSDFAAWRLPGESVVSVLSARSSVKFNDLEEMNGRCGFVIFPYDGGLHPGVLLEASVIETFSEPSGELPAPFRPAGAPSDPPADYVAAFEKITSVLRDQNDPLKKAALSYSFRHEWGGAAPYPAAEAFARACLGYRSAYVFMFRSAASGLWMGCSPEILLSNEKNEWKTVALAGTAADREGLFSTKNMEEHLVVVDYIHDALRLHFGWECAMYGPYPLVADSGVIHLCTEMLFGNHEPGLAGGILKALHPTPAVSCGRMSVFEGYDRRYYTGFAGMLDPGGRTGVYVNLRCVNIEPDALTLYAGGGLTAGSILADEWSELTSKLKTMLAVV